MPDTILAYLPFRGEMGPLLTLSLILMAGLTGGWIARRLRVPGITGNILAGVLIAPLLQGFDIAHGLQPLSKFAMGLITVSVGSHLSYRRVHNALRRIVTIALLEVLGAVACVTLAIRLMGADWFTAFVLGCIAAETAPATTLALIRETRAKGPLVKTLLSTVALDNMLCIMLFAFASMLMVNQCQSAEDPTDLGWAAVYMAWQFGGALLVGLGLGAVTERLMHRKNVHDFSAVFIVILLNVGLSELLGLNSLLTGLFLGIYLGNASEEASRQTRALEPLEFLLFICFFTLAGASLHLATIPLAGLLCLAYFLARYLGKVVGACVGGLVARTSPRIWTSTCLGLMPQAGVGVGLVLVLRGDDRIPEEVSVLISTVVLAAVTINEIIGPFLTRAALARSGEANKDRRRLIEFLQEEYILVNLRAKDKWEALRKVTDFYMRTHHVAPKLKDTLYATIEERERELTTAIGKGAAIPHGRIESGTGIRGVLAICRDGVDFHALDGEPVHLIMLVVTPKGYEKEHLEVMASLAQMVSSEEIRTRLRAAIDANDAWEIIENEDTRDYNYFLEEVGGDPAPSGAS